MTTFACDMSVMTPVEREQHLAVTHKIFGAVQEVRELSNGYSFRLENEEDMLMQTTAFVAKERLCCPFFRFGIEVGPDGGPLWLSLTGPEGVKPFIKAEVGELLAIEWC